MRLAQISTTLVAVAILLTYGLFGLYPYDWQARPILHFKNSATFNLENELEFQSRGIALTSQAPSWLPTAIATSSLQVLLEVRSSSSSQTGPARIFTISSDPYARNLTVGQEDQNLIVRMRSPFTDDNGIPEHVIEDVFEMVEWHKIELKITTKVFKIQVNGENVKTIRFPPGSIVNWSPNYNLAFGNELSGNRPWLGSIRKAIINTSNKSIDYLATDELYIPRIYTISDRHAKVPPIQLIPFVGKSLESQNVKDWFINFFGFIPLGWLITKTQRIRSSVYLAAVLCATFSLAIECNQLFLPSRTPSVEDVILNTLGGTLGALIFIRRRGDMGRPSDIQG